MEKSPLFDIIIDFTWMLCKLVILLLVVWLLINYVPVITGIKTINIIRMVVWFWLGYSFGIYIIKHKI